MRRLTSLVLLSFIVSAAAAEGAQQVTAYQALRTVAEQMNRAYLNRVVSVTGAEGDPQPTRWTILLADRGVQGGIREVQVTKRGIVANRAPSGGVVGSAQNAMFAAAKLNLDSDGAFSVASYTANTSHVNFDSVAYTLRTNERGMPFWIVTLQDGGGRAVGKIHINATRGNIARVEGMFGGANMAQGTERREPPRVTQRSERTEEVDEQVEGEDSDDAYVEFNEEGEVVEESDVDEEAEENDEWVVKREIKRMFRRSKRGVEGVYRRTRQSFQEFLDK